ncbi:MAG: hypothetical protein GY926_24620, partial [bacterium]|nr:hypothetical protein [bacterium]
ASSDIAISAGTRMAPGGIILGLAVGGEGAGDFALGGSVVANTIKPTIDAHVTGGATILSAGGNITVAAQERDLVISSGAGVISASTGSKGGAAVGAAVPTNTVESTVRGYVEDAQTFESTGGTVNVTADREDTQIVAVALGGDKAASFALGASVATNTVTHTTDAHVSGGTKVSGKAGVMVQATEESPVIVAAAGNFAISNKGVAIGASVPTNTVTRHLTAYVGDEDQTDFDQGADGASLNSTAGAVTVAATRQNSLLLAIGVSGVGAENFSLGGSVVESNIKSSTVDAHVWGGTLDGNQGVVIQAKDTNATNVAGAGNLDLSFLFQSSGSNNADNSQVQQQDLVRKATQNAEEDLDNDESISNAEEVVEDDLMSQEEADPEQIARHGLDDFGQALGQYQLAIEEEPATFPSLFLPESDDDSLLPFDDLEDAGVSIGLALANNLASRDTQPRVQAFASDATLTSDAGTIQVTADQTVLFVTVAGSGSLSKSGVTLDGTEATTVYRPITKAYIDATGATSSTVKAKGNVIVAANNIVHAITIAGNIAFNKNGSSVALTFATMDHTEGTTEAYIDHADVIAKGDIADSTVKTGVKGQLQTINDFRGVSVAATSKQVFTTVAAGIEVAGKLNVAASVSINLVGGGDDLLTKAFVGEGATINQTVTDTDGTIIDDNSDANARQSINVFAHSDTTIQGGGGAFGVSTGETFGFGAGVDGGRMNKTTEAYLAASVANAANVISVQAYSDEDLLSFAGSVQLSTGESPELAGALGVYVFDLTTNAYIGSFNGGGATKTVHSDGSVLVAANNDTTINYITGALEATTGDAAVGGALAVNVSTGHTNAFISDDAVVTALAGEMTDTIAAATGGYKITFSDDTPDDGSSVAPPGSVPSGTAGDGLVTADDPVWTKTRAAAATYNDIQGVAVTSNVSETIKGYVVAAGVSKAITVDIGGFIPVSTRHSVAYIAGEVNQGADDVTGVTQDVVVSASTDYHAFGLVIPIAVSAGGGTNIAGAGGVGWISANLTTEAYIADGARVSAGGGVWVVAAATEHVTRYTIGGAGTASAGSGGAVELSVTGVFLTSTTTADIRGGTVGDPTMVSAGGTVLVSATDDTVATGVAGGVGVVLSEDGVLGGGGGVAYTHIDKTTVARISAHAQVDATGNGGTVAVLNGEIDRANQDFFTDDSFVGVAVQAQSSEHLTNFGFAGAGSAMVGVAGGVTYTNVDSDTTATIEGGASVSTAQSVNVSASNAVVVLDVGGAFAVGGAVSLSGGVDVGIIRNTTTAVVEKDAVVQASRDVSVYALSLKHVTSYAVSVGVSGVIGVGASVAVWTLGDALDSSFDTISTSGNDGLAIQDNSDSSDPTYSSFAGYADGQSDRSDVTDAMSGYTSPDDQPDGNVNQTAFLSLREQTSGTVAAQSTAQGTAASEAILVFDTSKTAGITKVVIAGQVTATNGDVSVGAKEDHTLKYVAGAVVASLGASIGAGIGVATINGNALAQIDGVVTAGGGLSVTADQQGHLDGTAIIGEASVLGSAGAGVAIINDHSQQEASIRDGAQVRAASSVDVTASHSYSKFETLAVEAELSVVGAAGASVARSLADGSTKAFIGDAMIGDPTATSAPIGDVTIEAISDIRPKARAYAGSGGVFFAGDGNWERAKVLSTVTAYFGSSGGDAVPAGTEPEMINRIGGDVTIVANSTAEPKAIGLGIAVAAGVSIPVTLTKATAAPTVEAYLDQGAVLHVIGNGSTDLNTATGRLEIVAIAADDPHADGRAAGLAIASGGGTGVFAENFTALNAYIGDDATVTTNTDVVVKAEQEYVGYARGKGDDYGLLAVGINEATLDIEPIVQAYIGGASVTAGGDVIIESESGSPGTLPDLSFDSSATVDYEANEITFLRPHGLETGESVIYRANDLEPIGGLVDGSTYQVVRISDVTIQLGTFITADQVDDATGEIQFDLPHTIESGTPVVYDANGNPWINGLRSGVTYFVNAVDASAIKLAPTVEIATNESTAAFNGSDDVNYDTDEIRLPVSHPTTGLFQQFALGGVGVNTDFITTKEKSTKLQVGDAVFYAPDVNGERVKPLTRFGVYYIAEVDTTTGSVRVKLAESPADAAIGNTIHFTTAGAGKLVGVDAEAWQVSGAGVNSPTAFVLSNSVDYGGTRISPIDDSGFPFVTGDQVTWLRPDGDYSDSVRFGLLPFISYYVHLTTDGTNPPDLQLAETLADRGRQNVVKFCRASGVDSDPRA